MGVSVVELNLIFLFLSTKLETEIDGERLERWKEIDDEKIIALIYMFALSIN